MTTLDLENVAKRLDHGNIPITIADPRLHDIPLIYVNKAFCKETGYAAEEFIGQNCRFLQGDLENEAPRDVIRTALAQGRSGQAVFRNRRKDGSVFNQLLMLEPLYDSADRLVYVVGSQFVLTPRNRAKAADEHALQVVKEIDRLLELNDRLRSSTRETLARSTAASVKLWLDN